MPSDDWRASGNLSAAPKMPPIAIPVMDELQFIVSTGPTKKADEDARKLIRSHVMMGKNLGRVLPKRSTKARSPLEGTRGEGRAARTAAAARGEPADTRQSRSDSNKADPPRVAGEALMSIMTGAGIPDKIGSDLSLIRFADTAVEPSAVMAVLRFSAIAKQMLYPLETCVAFERPDRRWLEPLFDDPVYLHTMVSTTQDYFGFLASRGPYSLGSKLAPPPFRRSPHVVKALSLLRERLALRDQGKLLISDTTICVVMTLAVHAHVLGDREAADFHLAGLRKMVTLRGGVSRLRDNAKLLIELLRFDLGMSLNNGGPPAFFQDTFFEPFTPYPASSLPCDEADYPSHTSHELPNKEGDVLLQPAAPELIKAWRSLKKFCSQINLASKSNTKLPKELMLDTMTAVMYRLIAMKSTSFPAGSLNETLRLGTIASAASVFCQWTDVKLPYVYLAGAYRESLKMGRPEGCSDGLWLWLLMMGAISVSRVTDDEWLLPCLREAIESCGVAHAWCDVRDVMKAHIWVGLLHDKPGRAAFEAVSVQCPSRRDLTIIHMQV
ncbi:hypothetical protein B0H66DRAFT_550028 [Apodospora peruviana]|uniref:Uncharacterized protein n=1 Tax=Apodospora peruviana TaxID=516989 RepID=A0AAE0IJ65_9PEZI|nr:hypothetical protein B0H66DRAFT_550028 [Apodospora peruviana]